ncbi:hypothetical protein CLAFUW4_10438 [Fulvia fulva]|uniref:RING-type domain-containing protein n=1 Tax=Passalora fulva TaxID=5499 RepID=A0A9Q8P802_PASFU|nr:uncharacterized protein CLAFUR5_05053 [Fulvia fulva]KAK4615659.1 hypothetical protein CLAFUR4_10442 [Fulvia fulva]KAK4616734.1 hypothetical protein CLAFUR0_10443 [Fulvia fulva]UJO16558.1 hypothetical protein CLAFUR5_05053 [Fulvia fulva]WPV19554.1 hypothetical protein CLAFUW4_10438 [Fulvia fulva]WPV33691.1 hypothetical protein CLAFUW7_10438 [Fulvia fulva]
MASLPDKDEFIASLSPSIEAVGDCSICYENERNFNTSIITPCRHNFCAECLKTWLETSNTCPCCRAELCQKELEDSDDDEDDVIDGEDRNAAAERDELIRHGFGTFNYPEEAYERMLQIFQDHFATATDPYQATVLRISVEDGDERTVGIHDSIIALTTRNDWIWQVTTAPTFIGQSNVCFDILTVSQTSCHHNFCWHCITERSKLKNTCPACREVLFQQEVSAAEDDFEDSDDEEVDSYGETAKDRNAARRSGYDTHDYTREEYDRLLRLFQDHIKISSQPDAAQALVIPYQGQTPSWERVDIAGIVTQTSDGRFTIDEKQVRCVIRHKAKIAGQDIWTARFE